MIKVMFVCHGNICRSPMAEFVLKSMVDKLGMSEQFLIKSSATSTEEIGNGVYYATEQILLENGIECKGKYAIQFKKSDYEEFDYIIGMDSHNIRNILNVVEDIDNKVFRLLDFTDSKRDVADPWYTRDFKKTYKDITLGCEALLYYIRKG